MLDPSQNSRPPRDYFSYLWLISGTLLLFVLASFQGITLSLSVPDDSLGTRIVFQTKDSKIKQFFHPEPLMAEAADSIGENEKSDHVDSSAQKFLFIGDSMLEFLRIRLNDYCRKNGHTMNTVIWYSSSSLWYGQCDTLKHFIHKHKPTYVLLCLGANELFIKDIKTERAPFVSHIVKQMGDLPFVWIGPPNWKDDTGINDLILSYTGKSRYYPSKNLSYNRTRDGAHPTRESAYKWMDSVAVYLQKDARHRILMEMPDTFFGKIPPTEILQPNAPF